MFYKLNEKIKQFLNSKPSLGDIYEKINTSKEKEWIVEDDVLKVYENAPKGPKILPVHVFNHKERVLFSEDYINKYLLFDKFFNCHTNEEEIDVLKERLDISPVLKQ